MKPLHDILSEWAGTPYRGGHSEKKVGTDCYQFLTAVFSEWTTGVQCEPVKAYPLDTALHNKRLALRIMRDCTSMFNLEEIPSGSPALPGDVLVCTGMGMTSEAPTHCGIVDADGVSLWHATQKGGVCKTSVEAVARFTLFHFRHPEREKWQLR